METGEVKKEKVHASPRPPPKISLKHDWMKHLGSEDARRPHGQVVQPSKSSQSNQPTPNPDHNRPGQPVVGTDRTGQPVVGTNPRIESSGRKTSRSQEIETCCFREEAVKHDRTGQPVVETGATQTRSSDDSKSFNVEDRTAHNGTGQLVVSCHINNVPDGSQTCSCHGSTSFNVGD